MTLLPRSYTYNSDPNKTQVLPSGVGMVELVEMLSTKKPESTAVSDTSITPKRKVPSRRRQGKHHRLEASFRQITRRRGSGHP